MQRFRMNLLVSFLPKLGCHSGKRGKMRKSGKAAEMLEIRKFSQIADPFSQRIQSEVCFEKEAFQECFPAQRRPSCVPNGFCESKAVNVMKENL
jgi:hypothetical protein